MKRMFGWLLALLMLLPLGGMTEETAVEAAAHDVPKDGVYTINVDSSSTMFRIVDCELTVADGVMTARMTMGGTGYLYVYMGTGEEALGEDDAVLIPFEEQADGTHVFTVPVSVLNQPVSCAAFSKNKEKWYDRELVFRGDSLPLDAFENVVTVQSLGLTDGSYTVDAVLAGGSGRTYVESPAGFEVAEGNAIVTVVFSSKHYDYLLVKGEKYLPVNKTGNSTFVIPLEAFDRALAVTADTVAMSQAHEIDYTLTFDAATIRQVAE